jgi:uncharacterized membrane protein YbhN (UPF0104 family)
VAQIALTVLVTWFIVDRLGPGILELSETAIVIEPSWGTIAASCLVLAAGYLASGWIWGRMVRDLGGPQLSFADAVRIYMVSNLGRYVPGKLWQIAGMAMLARARGVSAPVATAAAVIGQAVALAGATLVGLLVVLSGSSALAGWTPWMAGGAALVVALVAIPAFFRPLVRLWLRLVPGDAPKDVPVGPLEGLRWLALYTLNWGGYALAFWLLVRGMFGSGELILVGPAFAAAYVLGYLALFAPAGIGVREGFLVAFLTPTLGAGGAALAAVTSRVWTTVVEVIPAAAFWLGGMGRGDAAARAKELP